MSGLAIGIQGSGQLVGELPDPGLFAESARLAERVGYGSIWAGDHVSFENPILDVTVALATFAAVTSSARLSRRKKDALKSRPGNSILASSSAATSSGTLERSSRRASSRRCTGVAYHLECHGEN